MKQTRRRYSTRLERKERQHQWRVAFFWLLLSIIIVVALVRYGPQAFIDMAVWYGDQRNPVAPDNSDDLVPPAPPRLQIPYDATSSATLDLKGFSEPGATVMLYQNQNDPREITVDASGQFLISDFELDKGYNWLHATATDQAGNESQKSKRILLTYDNKAPDLEVLEPSDGSQFYGTGQKRVTVSGTTDKEASVRVNDRSVIVGSSGSFDTALNLEDGEQTLSVVATDDAGNQTEVSIIVTYHP